MSQAVKGLSKSRNTSLLVGRCPAFSSLPVRTDDEAETPAVDKPTTLYSVAPKGTYVTQGKYPTFLYRAATCRHAGLHVAQTLFQIDLKYPVWGSRSCSQLQAE
jgi:hypothetical protein